MADFLVFYLISYQADPECPTPVRRLLEGGLLDKRPDRLERIAAALRKLETEGHIKGRLQARLEGHDLSLPPVRVPGLSVPLGEEREAGPTQEDRDEGDAGPSTSRAQGRHASADIGDRGGGTNTEGGPTRQAPKTGRPRYPKKLWDVGSRPRRAQLPSASSPLNIEPRRLTDEEAEALYELILRERTGETGGPGRALA
ncbi:hypothetical protein VTK73DRAFT_2810 [Phialemonium thermophilum]|uniref:DUF1376 domain-containing protein n=1 Tax=Phialemonium thermophilum TaxID=223376 RepID=A0ABR3VNX1_9PEZI